MNKKKKKRKRSHAIGCAAATLARSINLIRYKYRRMCAGWSAWFSALFVKGVGCLLFHHLSFSFYLSLCLSVLRAISLSAFPFDKHVKFISTLLHVLVLEYDRCAQRLEIIRANVRDPRSIEVGKFRDAVIRGDRDTATLSRIREKWTRTGMDKVCHIYRIFSLWRFICRSLNFDFLLWKFFSC